MFVIQYDDGLFSGDWGFPVKLDEATRYETEKIAQAEVECLLYDAKVIPDPSEKNL